MLNRTLPPITHNISTFDLKQVSKTTSGDVDIYYLNAGTQPVIKLEFLFPIGGNYYEPRPGVSMLCLQLLKEGSTNYTSKQIADSLAQFGAFLDINPSFDAPSISLLCLNKHLNSLLPIISDILLSPSFPDEELETLKRIQIQNLKNQNRKNNVIASKNFRNALFGDEYPYGKIISETDITNITTDDIKAFFTSNLSQFEIFVSGALDQHLNSIIRNFQNTKPKAKYSNSSNIQYHFQPQIINQNKDNSSQTSVRVGKPIISKSHNDYVKLLITNHILGGYFGSRLMKNIREDKGYTYGIYSSIVNLQYDSYLVIGSDIIKESLDDTLAQIRREISILQNEPISSSELDAVRNHLIGSFQSSINTPFAIMSKFKNIHMHGLDYSFYNNYITSIQSIDPYTILNTANEYFSLKDMTIVTVG
ncbi:M16 family metallopeptidase [Fulvivirga sediminis]|uniref:Insulinase family protein n=1 Tax=Fulvivirga sediminis TaxID=2803949 RepID=A0A937F654_9BACT|nr:pitrilysin family protein [Fulvivirga sediminis]MBL3657096.1 insulinase family protein [Fulvivirga sediminis]